ncbi:MAG: hypothetical protein DHS20C05_04290 [Hyphococcus sp.]|nr:MAG: hypothetical protein DHS20C05_04290 [Marinicaulis sp.]
MLGDLHGGESRHGGIASFAPAPLLRVFAIIVSLGVWARCKETRLAAFLERDVPNEMIDPGGQGIGAEKDDAPLSR